MMHQLFGKTIGKRGVRAASVCVLALAASAAFASDGGLFAVVPTAVIYPGQTIESSQIKRVEVTNPGLQGDYAQTLAQVQGKITTRTLLPDHAIYISGLKEPYAVNRGTQIRMIYDNGNLVISAKGLPLEDGSIGDVIRVRNIDSGLTISGTVLAAGTVRVVEK